MRVFVLIDFSLPTDPKINMAVFAAYPGIAGRLLVAVNGNLDLVTVAEDEDKTKEIALITVWIPRLLRLSPPIRSV